MLLTVEGFSQELVLKLVADANKGKDKKSHVSLDVIDLVLLRWFIFMKGLDLMEKISENGHEFVWIDFNIAIRHIPLLGISNPEVISRRFSKYAKLGLLLRKVKYFGKARGTKAYFSVTEKLAGLIITKDYRPDSKVGSNAIDPTQKSGTETTQKSGQSIKKRKKEKSAHISVWKEALSECRRLYNEKYSVGLQIAPWPATLTAFEAVGISQAEISAAFKIYLADPAEVLTKEKHPWRTFLSQLSTYAAKAKGAAVKAPARYCPKCKQIEASNSTVCTICNGPLEVKNE
jgi:hypothetical protein